MTSFVSLQGQGGGRIPMDGVSYTVSRHDLVAILATLPLDASRALHRAVHTGDTPTAQHLLRTAARAYYATTPAAPTAPLVPPHGPPPQPPRSPRRPLPPHATTR